MSYLNVRAAQKIVLIVPSFANEDEVSKDIKLQAQGYCALTKTSCLGIHSYSANTFWLPTLLPSALIDAENTKNANEYRERRGKLIHKQIKIQQSKTTVRMYMRLLFRIPTVKQRRPAQN